MTDLQKRLCNLLQRGLLICRRPFQRMAEQLDCTESQVMEGTRHLREIGIIRRIAAVVNHRKLGYIANSLLVTEVPEDLIVVFGRSLASLPQVTHCYQREGFPGWSYSLYAMIHGQSKDEIRQIAEDHKQSQNAGPSLLLDTVEELKKQPVMYA